MDPDISNRKDKLANWPIAYPREQPMISEQDLDWMVEKLCKYLVGEAQKIEDDCTNLPRDEIRLANEYMAKGLRKASDLIAEGAWTK